MSREAALKLVSAMGIDTARPLALQVSRFDLWKDPWGVIDAFSPGPPRGTPACSWPSWA